MAKRGQPKRFADGSQMVALWSDFCTDIVQNSFYTVPTQTAFCKWLSENYMDTDRRTIYNSLRKYFPEIKRDFEQLQSDVIMQGAMMGKYNATMSIFGLKNWCGWGDGGRVAGRYDDEKQEDALSKALREEAERMEKNADQ